MLVEVAIAEFGSIDVLFNNAGISGVVTLHEIDPDVWDVLMSYDVMCIFLHSK
ncbi:SDR family NAD(P)-dependent oxidoreductase [Paenibacillus germinis]|uniref:SDR family NAD(P)-dependent oxidoreductase n=1 Tax=Paenibacillus germinis TaxID=2654979 RepID=UPI0028ADA4FA|nr:SDR family NAD(P)-dependent oxidoreductase [Paenibacillus germinis]